MEKKTAVSKVKSTKVKSSLINRVPTLIPGFDKLIQGGIPFSSMILVTGGAGTGKSVFGMNFLVNGIDNGERGIYVSLEKSEEEVINEFSSFSWNLSLLVEKKFIMVSNPELYDFEHLVTHIEDLIVKFEAKRVVIDSTAIISLYFNDPFKARQAFIQLDHLIKRLGVTLLVISEMKESDDDLSVTGVAEFVCDGIIILAISKGKKGLERTANIRKMHETKHPLNPHKLEISNKGINIK